jgi:chaperonin cofactor prefoldin
VNRVWARFDEYKKVLDDKLENRYVQKNVCDILHQSTASNLQGTEKRIDARLEKLENRVDEAFDKIEKKVDTVFNSLDARIISMFKNK